MTTDEALPIIELIEARYIHNKTFYRQSALSVFYDVLEPYDTRIGFKVVREWLDARRDPPTDSELAAALRQEERRQDGRTRSDADKYKPQPGKDYPDAKAAFNKFVEGFRESYQDRHEGEDIPLWLQRKFDKIAASLGDGGFLRMRGMPAGTGPMSMDEAIAQKGGKG